MDFIQGFDRNQLVMMDFEANVDQDSWARVVDWFVDALPVSKLGFDDILQTERGVASLQSIVFIEASHVWLQKGSSNISKT